MINPLSDFITLIFPNSCITCRKDLLPGETYICFYCLDDLPYTHYEKQPNNPVKRSFTGRTEVEEAMSFLFFEKRSKTQTIMHYLKYKNMPELGQFLGELIGEAMSESENFNQIDGIVPVPLHPTKKRIRGYNQSEEISRGISDVLKIPVLSNALHRRQKTSTQTRKKRYERWENVKEVFETGTDELKNYRHILLVDDVITTGATLESCIAALKDKNQLKISVATLAYSD